MVQLTQGDSIVSRYAVYGITLETDFTFEWPVPTTSAAIDLRFDCVATPPVDVDLASSPAVHEVAVAGDEDRPDITYHRLPDLDIVRVRGAADHYIWPDRIVCHLHDPSLAYLVEIQLLGLVLAVWLERRGIPTLHASSVAVDGSAVAFLGVKGGGKTTVAAGMVAAGHTLLVDDLLALVRHGDHLLAHPGYPMLRLWPDQADHFLGSHDHLPLVHPAYTKRRIIVGEHLGLFHNQAAPLRHVYLPARDVTAREVTFEPVSPRDAFLAMLQESFLRGAVHGLGLAAGRFAALAGVVASVETRRVRYPVGLDRLPELAEAIVKDVATGDDGSVP